jgi:hypothetical protein
MNFIGTTLLSIIIILLILLPSGLYIILSVKYKTFLSKGSFAILLFSTFLVVLLTLIKTLGSILPIIYREHIELISTLTVYSTIINMACSYLLVVSLGVFLLQISKIITKKELVE